MSVCGFDWRATTVSWHRCSPVFPASWGGTISLRSTRLSGWKRSTRKRRPSPTRCRASHTRSSLGWAKSVGSWGDALDGLDADALARAVGCYYMTPYVEEPAWYRRAIRAHPEPCARALVAVHRSLIRRRKDHNNHLFALAGDALYAEVARRGVPSLLGVFPTRCSRTQVSALHALLWAALVHVPAEEFVERLRRRVAARGMDVAQRAVWLGAGLISSAREFTPTVVSFVEKGREPRARHILRFLGPGWLREPAIPEPWVGWDTADIAALVRALGSWYDPWWGGLRSGLGSSTFSLRTDGLIKRWLMILAERPGPRVRSGPGFTGRRSGPRDLVRCDRRGEGPAPGKGDQGPPYGLTACGRTPSGTRAGMHPCYSACIHPSRSISRSMCARWCRPCQA